MAVASTPLPPELPAASASPRRSLSRRQLLLGAAAGGAALVATNAASALLTQRNTQAVADQQIGDLEAEIRRLRLQLALYGDLERVGLDHLIGAALDLYDRLWPPIRNGLKALLAGLGTAEAALGTFENGLGALRGAAQAVRDLITHAESLLEGAREVLNEVIQRVAPLGEAVGGFLGWLVSRIPFGVGARALEGTNRLSALASAVPPVLTDTRQRLLDPLDQEWLASADGEGLQGRLFDPLRQALLDPLRTHLEKIGQMSDSWDADVAGPLRTALTDREKIRKQIGELEKA